MPLQDFKRKAMVEVELFATTDDLAWMYMIEFRRGTIKDRAVYLTYADQEAARRVLAKDREVSDIVVSAIVLDRMLPDATNTMSLVAGERNAD